MLLELDRMRFRLNLPGALFLLTGLILVAVAAWLVQGVREVQQWPRVAAQVESSRVEDPDGSGYTAVIRVRYGAPGDLEAGRTRELGSGFRTSSHDWARSIADRYPVGSTQSLPVNPSDPSDVRLEPEWGLQTLLAPGILAFMALVFGGIGLVACLEGLFGRGLSKVRWDALGPVVFGGLFSGIGALALLGGLVWGWLDWRVLREWPEVQATVVSSRALESTNRKTRMLTPQITFRYTVEGRDYETTTTPGWYTTSEAAVQAELAHYAPGSAHRIRTHPSDPDVIRYAVDSGPGRFLVPGLLALFGLAFMGIGAVGSRFLRPYSRAIHHPERTTLSSRAQK